MRKEGINVLFRLKINPKFIRKFIKESGKDDGSANLPINIGKTKRDIRVIKYTIDDKMYVLGTTRNDLTVNELKKMYHDRWTIETQFYFAKKSLSLENIKSKSINRIRQDIAIHQLILTICYYLHLLI